MYLMPALLRAKGVKSAPSIRIINLALPVEERPFTPRIIARNDPWGFRDRVRSIVERKRWSKLDQDSSRVAAGYESPARKCRVKWNKCASNRRDDTRSHAHSLARAFTH